MRARRKCPCIHTTHIHIDAVVIMGHNSHTQAHKLRFCCCTHGIGVGKWNIDIVMDLWKAFTIVSIIIISWNIALKGNGMDSIDNSEKPVKQVICIASEFKVEHLLTQKYEAKKNWKKNCTLVKHVCILYHFIDSPILRIPFALHNRILERSITMIQRP